MNSVFISSSALELIQEDEMDFGYLLTNLGGFDERFLVTHNSLGVGIGTPDDRSDIRGLVIQDIAQLHLEDFRDELWPPLIKRLDMVRSKADSGTLRIDSSWGPHHHDGFTSFYVAPIAKSADLRAVCSLTDANDVCLWTIVPKGTIDDDLGLNREDTVNVLAMKSAIRDQANSHHSKAEDGDKTGAITTNLNVISPTDFIREMTSQQWTEKLTPEQKRFVFSDADHVQRLIGPAGSGKTLCLCLKAIFETKMRTNKSEIPRILFLTHSWALSFEIDNQIKRLDQEKLASQFISVYPLLELARERLQQTFPGHTFRPVGDDSADAKEFMHQKMRTIVERFVSSDWVTFRGGCSKSFVDRVEATEDRETFIWDVLNEIGSVINGSQLFPTKTDERKYVNITRNNWMMQLESDNDRRAVFSIYKMLQTELEADGLISYDQELNDFLSFLRSNAWNLARGAEGWDLVYVDEFHKLNTQEREVLYYLTKEREQPPIRFATDLMQGPSHSRMGRTGVLDSQSTESEEYGKIVDVRLRQVHRYTPQILQLANHIQISTGIVFDLPEGSSVSSEDGQLPNVVRNGSLDSEITWTIDHLNKSRKSNTAVIVVDDRQFEHWASIKLKRFLVMRGKDDATLVASSPQKVVIARADDVSGLQFEHVFLVGLTDDFESTSAPLYRQSFLSNLYTGVTRSSSSVTLIYNNDQGCPEVIRSAISRSICTETVGREI
jgi:superfamily I DNA/RNA helicase